MSSIADDKNTQHDKKRRFWRKTKCAIWVFFLKNQTITTTLDVNSLRRSWAELRQEVNASCGRLRLSDFCHIRYVTSGEPIGSLFCVFEWLMDVTCSEKQEKRARIEVVEANACQSAVEVTWCLLLYPRRCQRGAQGAPGYKRPFSPLKSIRRRRRHVRRCLFKAQVSQRHRGCCC